MPLDPPGIDPNLDPDPSTTPLQAAIIATILLDSICLDLIGNRAFPNSIPQSTKYGATAVVVSLVSEVDDQDLDGPEETKRASYQLAASSKDRPSADRLARRLKTLFFGYSGYLNGIEIDNVLNGNRIDLPEQPQNNGDTWIYRIVVDLDFMYRE